MLILSYCLLVCGLTITSIDEKLLMSRFEKMKLVDDSLKLGSQTLVVLAQLLVVLLRLNVLFNNLLDLN